MELTVLCLWRDTIPGNTAETISLSYLLIVTSLSFLMVGCLGLISETIGKSCRGIIMSLQRLVFYLFIFLKSQTDRMTEQEAHHKESTRQQSGTTHPPQQNTRGKKSNEKHETINDTISQKFSNCLFHGWREDKEAQRDLIVSCLHFLLPGSAR